MQDNSSHIRTPCKQVMEGLSTKSDKIRALAKAGYTRTEISEILEIRYQHVRKVLVDAGITEGLKNTQASRSPLPVSLPQKAIKEEYPWTRLLDAGFHHAGNWELTEDGSLRITGDIPKKPGVYALILDGIVVYIGLTLNGLHIRMDQYRRGHKGQRTSARINTLIKGSLLEHKSINILVATPEPLEWNGLPVNGAAGLEAGLIELIRPKWNIQGA